jgi:hypothetical protein
MKDLLVTVKTKADPADASKGVIEAITIGATSSYPDLTTKYILNHGANLFGKNTMNIGITTNGLLSTANSTTVSSATTAFSNLTSSLGSVHSLFADIPRAAGSNDCLPNQTYSYILSLTNIISAFPIDCGLTVDVVKLFTPVALKDQNVLKLRENTKKYSGIFFKQDLPYKVKVSNLIDGLETTKIIFSPSESEVFFIPIPKTFFANNKSQIGLDNGVLTSALLETEGELTALFKFPAEVVKSYFAAIGQTFAGINTSQVNETNAINSNINLELIRVKHDLCMKAIAANDLVLLGELGCSPN